MDYIVLCPKCKDKSTMTRNKLNLLIAMELDAIFCPSCNLSSTAYDWEDAQTKTDAVEIFNRIMRSGEE